MKKDIIQQFIEDTPQWADRLELIAKLFAKGPYDCVCPICGADYEKFRELAREVEKRICNQKLTK